MAIVTIPSLAPYTDSCKLHNSYDAQSCVLSAVCILVGTVLCFFGEIIVSCVRWSVAQMQGVQHFVLLFVSPKISVFQFRSPVSQLILYYILGYWGSIHEVIVAHPLVCVLFGFNIWMCVFFGSIRLKHLPRLNQGKSILSRHSAVPERIWCVLLIEFNFQFLFSDIRTWMPDESQTGCPLLEYIPPSWMT